MATKWVIEKTPSNMTHLGAWLCRMEDSDWRNYTTMWESTFENMIRAVLEMGGRVTDIYLVDPSNEDNYTYVVEW